jgi:hypothetical protein
MLEKSRPKLCEGTTMVKLGGPSLVPLGSYLSFRTFISRSKGLGGNRPSGAHGLAGLMEMGL